MGGQEVRLAAGPFSALPSGAYGLCLDAGARNLAAASLRLDIPDFGLPEPMALRAALDALRAAMGREPGRLFYIGCRAGLGRTGTVLASLGAELGVAGDDPVPWVRAVHDPRAVGTPAQEAFARGWAARSRSSSASTSSPV